MRRVALAISALAFALAPPTLQAAEEGAQPPSPPAIDIAAGKAVAEACAACHGPAGISELPGVPHLAGQHAEYLVTALKAYRGGVRVHEDMKGMVAGLGAEDARNAAHYFASLAPFSSAAVKAAAHDGEAALAESETTAWDPHVAAREIVGPCEACHGDDGNSTEPGMPGLAGQPVPYLEASLKAYRDGARAHDAMAAFASTLSNADIELIAPHYAAIAPKPGASSGDGNLVDGANVAARCVQCHGSDGNSSDPAVPRLAGMHDEYLATAITAYQEEERDHPVMRDLVASLSESEIANVSFFYAGQKPKAPPQPILVPAEEWAQKCDRCHGPDGASTDPRFPILAGQSTEYLVRALRTYHTGSRENSMMGAMLFPLHEADFQRLAEHYAGKTAN